MSSSEASTTKEKPFNMLTFGNINLTLILTFYLVLRVRNNHDCELVIKNLENLNKEAAGSAHKGTETMRYI